jgi:arginase
MKNSFILTPLFLDRPVPGLTSLAEADWTVHSPDLPEGDQRARMSAVHGMLAALVEDAIRRGGRPVSIAGDCCAAIPVLAGLQRCGIAPTLIWFDAHGDFNTPESSPSGFLGGMPLAMIAGQGDLALPAAVSLQTLPESRIILTDGRDLDPAEKESLASSAVVHLTSPEDLLRRNLPEGPLYVHFDVDVVSLAESPAQNYPAAGGPSSALLHAIFRRLAGTGRVAAVSMSTWNPDLDKNRRSEVASMDLLQTLVGRIDE